MMDGQSGPAESGLRTAQQPASAHYAAHDFASATPISQRIALLDAAIRAASESAGALERGLMEEAHDRAALCRGLLLELACMIRFERASPLARGLNALSAYLHGLMVQATVERRPEPARSVVRLLQSERNAWVERQRSHNIGRSGPLRLDAVA